MSYVRVLIAGVDQSKSVEHTTKEYELRLGVDWMAQNSPEDTIALLHAYVQQVNKDLADRIGGVQ